MRQRVIIDSDSRPILPAHIRLQYDRLRGTWAVLAPERVMWPDEISVDILQRCDGATTAGALIDALAQDYNAPRSDIETDVMAFLQEWADQRLIWCGD